MATTNFILALMMGAALSLATVAVAHKPLQATTRRTCSIHNRDNKTHHRA